MPKIELGMREDISAFLPNAVETAIQSYRSFSKEQATSSKDPLTAREFKDHHDACKVAIAHIELLIKLAKWADVPPPEIEGEIENMVLQQIIERAYTQD